MVVFLSGTNSFELVNKHEILAEGKMYDIVKTKLRNGRVLYYTVSDTDEDDFFLDLTTLEKSCPDQKSLPAKIIKLYDLKYFDIKNKFISTGLWSAIRPGIRPVYGQVSCLSVFGDIFSPPPNRLLS